jgi:hypothetical protein
MLPAAAVVRRNVVLGDVRNDDGVWWRFVSLNDAGDLVIEGHDLGRGVESVWGVGLREYEFVRTVRAAELPALRRLLKVTGSSDLLDALEDRYAGQGTHELEKVLEEASIESEFQSRIGD